MGRKKTFWSEKLGFVEISRRWFSRRKYEVRVMGIKFVIRFPKEIEDSLLWSKTYITENEVILLEMHLGPTIFEIDIYVTGEYLRCEYEKFVVQKKYL